MVNPRDTGAGVSHNPSAPNQLLGLWQHRKCYTVLWERAPPGDERKGNTLNAVLLSLWLKPSQCGLLEDDSPGGGVPSGEGADEAQLPDHGWAEEGTFCMRRVTQWGTRGYLRSWVSGDEKEDGESYRKRRKMMLNALLNALHTLFH